MLPYWPCFARQEPRHDGGSAQIERPSRFEGSGRDDVGIAAAFGGEEAAHGCARDGFVPGVLHGINHCVSGA